MNTHDKRAKLVKIIERSSAPAWDALAELVHDRKSGEAAEVNNQGVEAQVNYLCNYGHSPEFILSVVAPSEGPLVPEPLGPRYVVQALMAGNDVTFSDIEVTIWAVVDVHSDPEETQILKSIHLDYDEAKAQADLYNQGEDEGRDVRFIKDI